MGRLGINWPELERQLRQFLPSRAVVSARQELLAYDCDGLTLSRHQPSLVVLPETTAQVAAAVKLCHQQGVPFVARGSGTVKNNFVYFEFAIFSILALVSTKT